MSLLEILNMHRVFKLENPIQSYAWGSHSAIAELLGRGPSEQPEAELWMGAHAKAPSMIEIDGGSWRLDEAIARYPEALLGPEIAATYGPRLPFLLKVLAAGQPLSIQAHPDLEQAAEGFEREQALGIPVDVRERNYRDRNHKPEIIYALTPFTALRGFLPLERIRERLDLVGLGELAPEGAGDGFRELLRRYLSLEGEALGAARAQVLERRDRLDATGAAWITRLEEHYPGDRGMIAPVFMRIVELSPGQALFTGPGVLHAYLDGVGIELMASSDNVLRCALTHKHVDADELLRIARFDSGSGVIEAERRGGASVFESPADEFRLSVIEIQAGQPFLSPRDPRGVEILLCAEGQGRLEPTPEDGEAAFDGYSFAKGDAFLVPGPLGRYRLVGEGTVFCAGVARCPS